MVDLPMESGNTLSESLTVLKEKTHTFAIMGHQTSPAAKERVEGLVPTMGFSIGNKLAINWLVAPNMSRDIDMKMQLLFDTEGAQDGKKVSFDVGVISLDSAAQTDVGSLTGTVQLVDLDIPTTASKVFGQIITIPAATFYASATTNALVFEFTRVASSADPTGDVDMFSVSIGYEIG